MLCKTEKWSKGKRVYRKERQLTTIDKGEEVFPAWLYATCQTNVPGITFGEPPDPENQLSLLFHRNVIHELGWGFVVVVQSPSHVWLFTTLWTAARQASLSLTISQSLPKFIGDAVQSSHPLKPSSTALNLSQHQGLFQWVVCQKLPYDPAISLLGICPKVLKAEI